MLGVVRDGQGLVWYVLMLKGWAASPSPVVQSIGDGVETTNELMDKVRRKEFKKRRVSVSPVIVDVCLCAGRVGSQ